MISAVILAHNDEERLPKTLNSLSWCDERLIIDGKSTDKTREIAKKNGAIVYEHALNDDFAAQRNFGLSKAKGEWVFFVDSDEIVSEELKEEIIRVMDSRLVYPDEGGNDNQVVGFYLKRKDYMWERWLTHGETSKVKLLRIAKKDAGKWVRPVHEIWEIKGAVGYLNNLLLHYPHENVAQFIDEINHYSTLNAKYLHERGIKSSVWQIVIYPSAKFFLDYFVYLGFLDGTAGAVMAILMGFHSFLTRAKLYLLT